MPTYKNGYIPESLLVTFAEGANTVDGTWKHQLSAGTYAKHLALVERSPGGRLQITPGWGAYRPYSSQVVARRIYGTGAAVPGTSSHGGFWEGKQTLAIDYHNWGSIYGWDQARFFADVRAVGLTPGMIMRSRGYPDEPWHVIDLDPWAPAPAATKASPLQLQEEDSDMPKIIKREKTGITYLLAPGFIHAHKDDESRLTNEGMYGKPIVHDDLHIRLDLETHGFGALVDQKTGALDLPAPGVTFIEGSGTKKLTR